MRHQKWVCSNFPVILAVTLIPLIIVAWLFFSGMLHFSTDAAVDFTMRLSPGWNLGNSLDSHSADFAAADILDYEQLWGNPVITPELFKTLKNAGFNSVRIPVTWEPHIEQYNAAGQRNVINPEWLGRVAGAVNGALESGLYVIIDAHHEDWLTLDTWNEQKLIDDACGLWAQIAERFAEYDERLIFDVLNEPRLIGHSEEWGAGTLEANDLLTRLNAELVKTIRAAGGMNETRYIMLSTYCGNSKRVALEAFVPPSDKRVILTVHAYMPYNFAMNTEGTAEWSAANPEDTQWADETFALLGELFTSRGIPVILGEFACTNKSNEPVRAEWTEYIMRKAHENRVACFWWDDGIRDDKSPRYGLIDRLTMVWQYPEIVRALTQPYGE